MDVKREWICDPYAPAGIGFKDQIKFRDSTYNLI
jgi:hypothetical protein